MCGKVDNLTRDCPQCAAAVSFLQEDNGSGDLVMSTEKFRQFFFNRLNIGRTLRESFDFVSGLVGLDSAGDEEKERIRFAVNSLVHLILLQDGRISRERFDICRRIWEERFSHADAAERLQELISQQPAGMDGMY